MNNVSTSSSVISNLSIGDIVIVMHGNKERINDNRPDYESGIILKMQRAGWIIIGFEGNFTKAIRAEVVDTYGPWYYI